MAKASKVNNQDGEFHGWMVFCPGCGCAHVYDSRWTFNGDVDKPTFKPSYLSRSTWGPNKEKRVCHSFVTDGKIKYLGDCTHQYKGQTIDLPDEFD